MSRQFIDEDLITWQVHTSTGNFSLPNDGRLIFRCVTDRERRPRSVGYDGDLVETEEALIDLSDEQLRELLKRSVEIR